MNEPQKPVQVIRPQVRGNMRGALVRDEYGTILELPVEVPAGCVRTILDRIESDLALLRGLL